MVDRRFRLSIVTHMSVFKSMDQHRTNIDAHWVHAIAYSCQFGNRRSTNKKVQQNAFEIVNVCLAFPYAAVSCSTLCGRCVVQRETLVCPGYSFDIHTLCFCDVCRRRRGVKTGHFCKLVRTLHICWRCTRLRELPNSHAVPAECADPTAFDSRRTSSQQEELSGC